MSHREQIRLWDVRGFVQGLFGLLRLFYLIFSIRNTFGMLIKILDLATEVGGVGTGVKPVDGCYPTLPLQQAANGHMHH